jgi:hypothetical protein
MKVDNSSPAALDMEEVRQQLEQFRSSHRPRCHIPASLWARAAELVRRHGLYATARTLHLDYTRLKKLAEPSNHEPKTAELPELVEMIGPTLPRIPEWTIEMEGGRGRMRIQVKGAATAELITLSQRLWGSEG